MSVAVCLVSGGLDSTVAAAIAKAEGFTLHGLTIDYGQRHRREIEAARQVAKKLGFLGHITVRVDLSAFGGSALTDRKMKVPRGRSAREMSSDIPVTYVPARNTVMLSIALAYAEVIEAEAIFIGANAIDYSGYPDCRPEYMESFERMAGLATKRGVGGEATKIRAPLIHLTKAAIVELGTKLGAPLDLTWSCYLGGKRPCGTCDSCILRAKGFEEAELADPALKSTARGKKGGRAGSSNKERGRLPGRRLGGARRPGGR
ncbi:MAG: 7-cyano-7-deazaguanine synthase QueC [Euryarchaeota archaeon]|nr:7-cyano-7-deazaguanine synthase QueC [Euryarchaeota archaeon]